LLGTPSVGLLLKGRRISMIDSTKFHLAKKNGGRPVAPPGLIALASSIPGVSLRCTPGYAALGASGAARIKPNSGNP
jgi:hypothetical protein